MNDVRHEVEVDRRIADASEAVAKAQGLLNGAGEHIHYAAGDKRRYLYGRHAAWTMTDADALAAAKQLAETDATYVGRDATQALAKLDAATETLKTARAALKAVEAEYQGWSRFFLVPGGHIHRSTACHSLRIDTQIGWLPELSGLTEADAVAEHGAILCTHCFPSAPVEWTNKYELEAEAKKANQCPGSGTTDWVKAARDAGQEPRYGRKYQTCPHCHKSVYVTSTSRLRAHKKES